MSKDTGTNPKDLIGATKAPLAYLPASALIPVAQVMKNGADKYGRANWRRYSVKRTIYLEAALRHILADLDGENIDPESGLPHAAHAAAGLLILLDAQALGKCVDDRPTPGTFGRDVRDFAIVNKKLHDHCHHHRITKHCNICNPAALGSEEEPATRCAYTHHPNRKDCMFCRPLTLDRLRAR